MTVRTVWSLDSLPLHYVVEGLDGSLHRFAISPFREIQESDLIEYKGAHPRRCSASPIPKMLYRHYGLVQEEAQTEMMHTRVTTQLKSRIESVARAENMTGSDLVRKIVSEYVAERDEAQEGR